MVFYRNSNTSFVDQSKTRLGHPTIEECNNNVLKIYFTKILQLIQTKSKKFNISSRSSKNQNFSKKVKLHPNNEHIL